MELLQGFLYWSGLVASFFNLWGKALLPVALCILIFVAADKIYKSWRI